MLVYDCERRSIAFLEHEFSCRNLNPKTRCRKLDVPLATALDFQQLSNQRRGAKSILHGVRNVQARDGWHRRTRSRQFNSPRPESVGMGREA